MVSILLTYTFFSAQPEDYYIKVNLQRNAKEGCHRIQRTEQLQKPESVQEEIKENLRGQIRHEPKVIFSVAFFLFYYRINVSYSHPDIIELYDLQFTMKMYVETALKISHEKADNNRAIKNGYHKCTVVLKMQTNF